VYDADAERVLAAARNSRSNHRIVLYGVARNSMEALRFSKYGVNAIFDEPLDRPARLENRTLHLFAGTSRIAALYPAARGD